MHCLEELPAAPLQRGIVETVESKSAAAMLRCLAVKCISSSGLTDWGLIIR